MLVALGGIMEGRTVAHKRTLSAGCQPPFLISLSLSIRKVAMGAWRVCGQ